MKVPKIAMSIVLLCMLTLFAVPEDQGKERAGAPAKLQVFFSELETQWLKAVQDKDPAALNRIVSDDFRFSTPASAGGPISRSDWLLGIFGRKLLSFQVHQLATREVTPQIVVVSFVLTETYKQSATPQNMDRYIVDIWINSGGGDNWRCTDRYSSEVKGLPHQK